MIRVVLDTNIVVSAALRSAGTSSRILGLAAEGVIQVWLSPSILKEYRDVLSRPRIGIDQDRCKALISFLVAIAKSVVPSQRVNVCETDPSDNMFLECAQSAKAHYVVTGNTKHFPERWKYARVLTPKQFIDRITT